MLLHSYLTSHNISQYEMWAIANSDTRLVINGGNDDKLPGCEIYDSLSVWKETECDHMTSHAVSLPGYTRSCC